MKMVFALGGYAMHYFLTKFHERRKAV